MIPDFVTVRDLDNAETTVNVKQIMCLIIPGPLSNNIDCILHFVGGNIKMAREEAIKLRNTITKVNLVN